MNRTIISLAIIKSHWEKNKSDYIDNFIPFTAAILNDKSYGKIDLEIFQSDFKERYGLDIPKNALITIFNRARKKGIVKRVQGDFVFDKETSTTSIKQIESADVERKFNKVVSSIIKFGKEEHNLKVDDEEIEKALLSFLKQHDLDILFAAKDHSVLPNVKSSKKLKYLISSFALFAAKEEPTLFQFLIDISIGHALSGAILYSEFSSFSGKLKDLNIYLDTPLILGLLGFSGEFKRSSIEELVKILNEEKANVNILDTTRDEVDYILNDSLTWLQKGIYDLEKASRLLRYCHREGITATDLEQKILSVDRLLDDYEIISTNVPDHVNNEKFQIDEKELKKTIKGTYKSIIKNYDSNDYSKEGTINRDVKVLSGIYRFREGFKPRVIKDSKHLFITSNTALAFASKIFESKENGSHFTIPTCLTDVFLGTVIWLQSPQKIENLNTKRFIADCYSATQPSTELIKKYMIEVEKLKSDKKINNDEYYILRTHRASLNLLEKNTMGDPEAFDGSSTAEILDTIMFSIKGEEEEKLKNEEKAHSKTKTELEIIAAEKQHITETLDKKSEKISKGISQVIFVLMIIITAICLIVNLYTDYFKPSQILKNILWVVIGVMTLLNLTNGFNILGLRDKIHRGIKSKILKWFLK